jgi:hypothetical protein
MHRVVEDHAKRRLTDQVDIAKAILMLSAKGVPADQLLAEMMKIFYVDLDQFNEVVRPIEPAALSEGRPGDVANDVKSRRGA